MGFFGQAASAYAGAKRQAREQEIQDEQLKRQEEDDQIRRLALMSSLQEHGVVGEDQRENLRGELPAPSMLGQNMPRQQGKPVDTGIMDPSRYAELGAIGGKKYYQDRAQQMAAQRAAERAARVQEALRISETNKNDASAYRDMHPVTPPRQPQRHYDADRGVVVDEGTGEVITPNGLPPKPKSSTNERQEKNAERQTVQSLQRDYQSNPSVKSAYSIADAGRTLNAALSGESAMDDLSLIYGTVKLFDPNAVKEGEIVTFSSGVSVPQDLQRMVQKWNTGKRLLPEQREQIKRLLGAKVQEADNAIRPVQADFGAQARRWGVEGDSAFIAPDPFRGNSAGKKHVDSIMQKYGLEP